MMELQIPKGHRVRLVHSADPTHSARFHVESIGEFGDAVSNDDVDLEAPGVQHRRA